MTIWLLRRVLPRYAWRLECPRTVESVAEHFLRHNLPNEAIELIAQLPAPEAEAHAGAELAWKRRICFIYGVATHYNSPGGQRGRVGWNRTLLSDFRDKDPEAAVDEIFRRVWQKARERRAGPGRV